MGHHHYAALRASNDNFAELRDWTDRRLTMVGVLYGAGLVALAVHVGWWALG